jgi:hypothetical protein
VRVRRFSKKSPVNGLWVSARRFSTRWKAFSGFCPSCSHRQGEAGSSGSQVNSTSHSRKGEPSAMSGVMQVSTSGDGGWSTRVCLRVTKGTSEVDTAR